MRQSGVEAASTRILEALAASGRAEEAWDERPQADPGPASSGHPAPAAAHRPAGAEPAPAQEESR